VTFVDPEGAFYLHPDVCWCEGWTETTAERPWIRRSNWRYWTDSTKKLHWENLSESTIHCALRLLSTPPVQRVSIDQFNRINIQTSFFKCR